MNRSAWTIEQSALGRIAIPTLLPAGLALFTTTIDFPGRLDDERARALLDVMRERFGVDAGLATATQVHGAELLRIAGSEPGCWREDGACDALATRERSQALGVKVADCLPVTLFDSIAGVVAGIHSGWRGAAAAIVPSTIERLSRDDSFDPSRALAFLGPSIRVCCFEVGDEVVEALAAAGGDVAAHVDRARGPKPHIDLPGLTRRLLLGAGFDDRRIDDSGICTRCDGSIFHSYRRDGARAGRNLSIAAMR
ncbi:MAG: polyphenol oxidase family protein [Acidobacteria bacterium]|nr:polyphenol oxidase family protein [Acidobacteriota bacterium]